MKTTYETKQRLAQAEADKTRKVTCIYETYEGYRVGFLTWTTVGSAQETFSPRDPVAHYEALAAEAAALKGSR
jgi:hypothetical protein